MYGDRLLPVQSLLLRFVFYRPVPVWNQYHNNDKGMMNKVNKRRLFHHSIQGEYETPL